jgi:hypothetical protein
MCLRLKEDPREWFKFTASLASAVGLLTGLVWWRGQIPAAAAGALVGGLAGLVMVAWLRPRWVRGLYRGGMRVSHAVGQVVGRALLAVMFLAVLTPLAWVLRGLGKDLLRLRRDRAAASYWRAARAPSPLDRLF